VTGTTSFFSEMKPEPAGLLVATGVFSAAPLAVEALVILLAVATPLLLGMELCRRI